jgi:transcriptional regulator with XRE-family HTH domain
MHETDHTRSALRAARKSIGVSARELAAVAKMSPTSLLAAEHGQHPADPAKREAIERALVEAQRRQHVVALFDATTAVERAQHELKTAQTRLAELEGRYQRDVKLLRRSIGELWTEPAATPGTDAEAEAVAA